MECGFGLEESGVWVSSLIGTRELTSSRPCLPLQPNQGVKVGLWGMAWRVSVAGRDEGRVGGYGGGGGGREGGRMEE